MYDYQEESKSDKKDVESNSKPGIQRKNKNSEFQKELQLKEAIQRNSRISNKEFIQAKFIGQDYKTLVNPVEMGGKYDLKVTGKAKGTKLSYPYLEYDYPDVKVDTKHKAMIGMQDALVNIGKVAPQKEMTGNVIAASDKNKSKVEWVDSIDRQGYYPQENSKYWPFAVNIAAEYKEKSLTNKQSGDGYISAFFAPGKYGYITEVASEFDSYDIDINEEASRLQLHVPESEDRNGVYSSEHSTDGVRDLVQDGIHMVDDDGADAWTKAVAEGARWNSVRELTKKSLLTNTSKFYTLFDKEERAYQEDDEENPVYIQFQDLWIRWREFDNKWDISGEKLATKLHNGLNGSNRNIDLETLESDSHNLGVG